MSFAGHVFDMVRRNKQNREMLREHHERMKLVQNKMHEGNLAYLRQELTAEELEQIEKAIKEKDRAVFFPGNCCLPVVLFLNSAESASCCEKICQLCKYMFFILSSIFPGICINLVGGLGRFVC